MMELMVAIAVVAILATLALPSFLERIAREQVRESMPIADIAKKPIAAAWATTQALPEDNAAAGLPAPEKIVGTRVSAMAVKDGAIHLTFGNQATSAIAGKVLTLRPAVVEDAPIVPVAWVCGNAPVPGKMTVMGKNLTSVPDGLLPVDCRGAAKGD